MHNKNLALTNKIGLASRVLLLFSSLVVVLAPIMAIFIIVLLIISPTSTADTPIFQFMEGISITLGNIKSGLFTLEDKLLYGSFVFIYSVLTIIGVYSSVKLLRQFINNNIFHSQSITHAKFMAYSFNIYVIIPTISGLFITNVFYTEVKFIFNDYSLLALLWIFVWLLEIGTSMHLENEMTI